MRAIVLLLAILTACRPVQAPAVIAAPAPVPEPPAMSLSRAAAGTLKVEGALGAEGWSGTAWVVQVSDGSTFLVTAGHVCADGATYELIESGGRRVVATEARHSSSADLCLLHTTKAVGPALPISPVDPSYGDPVAYVGAPLGLWGDGKVPYFTGNYVGGDMITSPAYGGSSGSAVWTSAGVIGVLVSGFPDFPVAIFIEPRAALVEFLAL